MSDPGPIGVLDSGVGGLSVLKHLHQLLPRESFFYLADSAWAPYGPKSDHEIRERCCRIVDRLLEQDIKALVLACNTATAAAVVELREQYAIPIVAMEPAIKPAVALSRKGVIAVLATEGTIDSERFLDLRSRFDDQVEIITVACHGLVDSIEQWPGDKMRRQVLLKQYIQPVLARAADTLILGCTHYPLIMDEIQAVVGSHVTLLDTGPAVARELMRRLEALGLESHSESTPAPVFFTTGDPAQQQPLLSHFWGAEVQPVFFPSG